MKRLSKSGKAVLGKQIVSSKRKEDGKAELGKLPSARECSRKVAGKAVLGKERVSLSL